MHFEKKSEVTILRKAMNNLSSNVDARSTFQRLDFHLNMSYFKHKLTFFSKASLETATNVSLKGQTCFLKFNVLTFYDSTYILVSSK